MDEDAFEDLLVKVAPIISKKDTTFRKAINACDRLGITHRCLATGENYDNIIICHDSPTMKDC